MAIFHCFGGAPSTREWRPCWPTARSSPRPSAPPSLSAHFDRLKAANPGVPFAVLIDGDSLEYGNAVARRTAGASDFALFAALAQRAPTILNLGNHEPDSSTLPRRWHGCARPA